MIIVLERVVDYPSSNFTNTSQTAPLWVRLPLKCQISIKGCVDMYLTLALITCHKRCLNNREITVLAISGGNGAKRCL